MGQRQMSLSFENGCLPQLLIPAAANKHKFGSFNISIRVNKTTSLAYFGFFLRCDFLYTVYINECAHVSLRYQGGIFQKL